MTIIIIIIIIVPCQLERIVSTELLLSSSFGSGFVDTVDWQTGLDCSYVSSRLHGCDMLDTGKLYSFHVYYCHCYLS